MLDIIIDVFFVILAVVSVIGSAVIIYKLERLNKRFSASIVLIPLYKKSKFPIIAIIIFVFIIIVSAIVMIVTFKILLFSAIIVLSLSMICIFITMLKVRCAVLDSGVVVPFKFIDWTHLYDYKVENNTIFFCGNHKGNESLSSVTQVLTFDIANADKLQTVLFKHKINK